MTAPFRIRILGLWCGLVFCAALPRESGAASPRRLHRQGEEAYAAGRFEEAARCFEETGRIATRAGQDPATARLNQGLALARAGRTEEAVKALTSALDTPDLDTQARAQYALGTLLGRQADAAAGTDDAAAVRDYEQALRRLEAAMRLAPTAEDSKVNHELAQARLQAVREKMEQQKQEQEKKPDEPKDPEQEPPKPEDQEKSELKDQKPKPEPKDQEPKPGAGDEKQKPETDKPEPSQTPPKDSSEKNDAGESGEPRPDEKMTPEEARMILDALRQDEDAKRRQIRVRHGEPEPVEKDW
jgi:tetratricopeptide (TPR) repeat protein